MSFAKSATANLTSKTDRIGPAIQDAIDPPSNYILQFRLGNVPVGVDINPVATITWKLGGNQVIRKCSIYDGASISSVAEGVDVATHDETDIGDLSPSVVYEVTIIGGCGVRPSYSQLPTYTTYLFGLTANLGFVSLAPGAFLDVPIPKSAGVISTFVTVKNAPGSAAPLGDNGFVVAQRGVFNQTLRDWDARVGIWVPMNPQCDHLHLENQLGLGAQNLFFAVTWGIDG